MFVPCLISIISATEEQETPFQLEGKGEFSCLKTVLVYNDGGADVRIEARNDGVTIERQGDYSMQILLREKQTTKGNLGIMGQRGDLDVYTEKLGFSSTERSFMLSASYSLIFPSDVQTMKIRLTARTK